MAPVKKYKLFSPTDGTGKPRACAFFLSGNGCKNGDNCKFAHVNSDDNNNESSKNNNNSINDNNEYLYVSLAEEKSVISSESGEVHETMENQFENAGSASSGNAGKKRKNHRSVDTNPFPSVHKTKAKAEPPAKKAGASPSTKQPPSSYSESTKAKKARTDAPPQNSFVSFRSLNLPIADFTLSSAGNHAKEKVEDAPVSKDDENLESPAAEPKNNKPKILPLPKSSPRVGDKWISAVKKCQEDARYKRHFDFEAHIDASESIGGKMAWIKARPFGDWCADNPQIIAIDCEMCETQDPVSKEKNHSALCRVSIVDAETDEVLLNTLVKPEWPVTDYRTFVNGISETDLAPVQFTIHHCQAYLMALCSEETVIVGHAVHHDLLAMRMEHYCVADSAFLFTAADNENATVSLKDLSCGILGMDMPKVHDSVNDARSALRCVQHYVEKDGRVKPIVRRAREERVKTSSQLFIHRIPKNVLPKHLAEMFLATTKVATESVDEIDFGDGTVGKTRVTFASPSHANLAFASLKGEAEADPSGKLQKKVFLRSGKYIRIRKMVLEKRQSRDKNSAAASPGTTVPMDDKDDKDKDDVGGNNPLVV